MRYPISLHNNGTIGFVAPSFGCATEPYLTGFKRAQKKFSDAGYGITLGPNCYVSDGIGISSTPDKCAKELMDGYCSPESDVLISCGGGELMCEILSYMDFDRISQNNPKWFMGYSDNTNFTFTLTTICDVASVYGPCASTFGMDPWHASLEDAFGILSGEKLRNENGVLSCSFSGYGSWEIESLKSEDNPAPEYNLTEKSVLKCFGGDSIKMDGRLVGGCLDCLVNMCGTKFDQVSRFNEKYADDGIIWFLEACDLNPMAIRRAMWELENAGWFEKASGFVIGRTLHFGEEMMGLDNYKAVVDIISHYNVPILMDVDLGHLPPAVPFICGSMAHIEGCSDKWTIDMKLI